MTDFKRVAVITDAMSPGYWFPRWYAYYGSQFQPRNLYVVTYSGNRKQFDGFELGGVWDVNRGYSDAERAKLITSFVEILLQTHDTVLRCDVDEFLIPDLCFYESLNEYVSGFDGDYETAIGVDVFETMQDSRLDVQQPVIAMQRKHAVLSTSLNKTALVRRPVRWAAGFHAANVPPKFGKLFLFHLKFSDIASRLAWFRHMKTSVVADSSEYKYFSLTEKELREHQRWLSSKPVSPEGWNTATGLVERDSFLKTVTKNEINGIFQGEFTVADWSFTLPSYFIDTI